MRDPYSVLGVKRDAGADEIKAAWRNKAKSSHPDHNHDDPNATQRFAEVGQAYDVLKDPQKRTRYDEQRFKAEAKQREQTIMQQREAAREAAERAKVAKANAERILAELALAEAQKARADKTAQAAHAYAKAQSGQAKPQPQQQQAQPGPAPAGEQQQQSQQSQTPPPGSAPENPEDLISRIFGSSAQASAAAESLRREAEAKAERGETPGDTATDENGAPLKPAAPRIFAPIEIITSLVRRIRGTQPILEKAPDIVVDSVIAIDDLLKQNSIAVHLPDGRDVRLTLEGGHTDGHVVRLKGQGLRLAGMQRGDVAVTLRVLKTDKFSVDGLDIHTVLPITLENAVLGCDTTIEGPNGTVEVKVPAWSGSDQVIRLEGLGLPGSEGSHGDLVIELRVVLWEKPDDKVTDLMRVMREGLFL